MSQIAIWLDRNTAKVFRFLDNQLRASDVKRENTDKILFKSLAQEVGDADLLLILGPGVAKHHFYNHLAEQYPALAKKIVGCEYSESRTDGQIVVAAQETFAKKASA